MGITRKRYGDRTEKLNDRPVGISKSYYIDKSVLTGKPNWLTKVVLVKDTVLDMPGEMEIKISLQCYLRICQRFSLEFS